MRVEDRKNGRRWSRGGGLLELCNFAVLEPGRTRRRRNECWCLEREEIKEIKILTYYISLI